MNGKILNELQRRTMVYDIERGKANGILPQPWQTDTCIGSWHYDAAIFKNHHYKNAPSVICMLADIVSKNGNLMLSVPLQRDGVPHARIGLMSESHSGQRFDRFIRALSLRAAGWSQQAYVFAEAGSARCRQTSTRCDLPLPVGPSSNAAWEGHAGHSSISATAAALE